MLKKKVMISAGILASVLSVGAHAAPFNVRSDNSLFAMARVTSDRVLGTFSVIASPGEVYVIDGYTTWLGYSVDAPCSDLTVEYTIGPSDGQGVEVDSVVMEVTADEMEFPGITCIRTDFMANGKTFSTGDIKFTWDADTQTYTDMSPRAVVLDLTI